MGWVFETGILMLNIFLGDNQTINISDDVDENDPNGDNWYYEPSLMLQKLMVQNQMVQDPGSRKVENIQILKI